MSTAFETIPVVDLAWDEERAASALRRAATEVGFFYLAHHGIDAQAICACFDAARRYFAQPLDEKMRLYIGRSVGHRGYGPLLEENTDPTGRGDLHEAFDIGLEAAQSPHEFHALNLWPDLDGFRGAVETYFQEGIALGRRLFRLFAAALGLAPDHFAPFIVRPGVMMRLIHYPPVTGELDPTRLGIGAHSDYECFTILATDDVPALEVRNVHGAWIAADPVPGCVIVNIGDQMARWTNDLFASTVHRVVNRSGRERYSVPLFFGADYDAVIEALPGCTGPERPARYPPITAGAHVAERLAATYGFYAKNDPG